jgi:hypothetical protein
VKPEGRAADEAVFNEVHTNLYKQKIPLLTVSALQSMFSQFYLCYRTAYLFSLKKQDQDRSRNYLKCRIQIRKKSYRIHSTVTPAVQKIVDYYSPPTSTAFKMSTRFFVYYFLTLLLHNFQG